MEDFDLDVRFTVGDRYPQMVGTGACETYYTCPSSSSCPGSCATCQHVGTYCPYGPEEG